MPHQVIQQDLNTDALIPPRAENEKVRDAIRDPLRFFMNLTKEYGDIVQYRATGEKAYFINHPDYIQHVLSSNWKNYNKDTYLNKHQLKALLGNGVITSESPVWEEQRRRLQPFFHRRHLGKFTEMMQDALDERLAEWEPYAKSGEPLNIAGEMMRLTLNIVTRSLLGADVGDKASVIEEAVDTLINIGRPKHPKSAAMIKILDEIVYGIIDKRRHIPESEWSDDLLGAMLKVRDEDTGEGMSDVQLRDEVMTLIVAGHETTANTLSWFWYVIGQHPDILESVRAELQTLLGGRLPNVHDFHSLDITRRAIDEGMRLYPSAWSISRRAVETDVIGGYEIPGGSIVAMSPYVLHRHPDFWENPEQYDPDRFLPERANGRHNFAFIPFGRGPRQCLGQYFAIMESLIIVAGVVQRFRMRIVPEHKVVPHALATLRPQQGVLVNLESIR